MTPTLDTDLRALLQELRSAPPPRCVACNAFESWFPHGDHPEDLRRCTEAGIAAHAFQPDEDAESRLLAEFSRLTSRVHTLEQENARLRDVERVAREMARTSGWVGHVMAVAAESMHELHATLAKVQPRPSETSVSGLRGETP